MTDIKLDQNPEVLESLRYSFENVNSWLKFAEGKHAALIAFNVAFISNVSKDCDQYNWLILTLIIALSISLLSFLPVLRVRTLLKSQAESKVNLLFFGHLTKNFSDHQYLEMFSEALANGSLALQLSDQIITNSRIAQIKYKLFNFALSITILSLLMYIYTLRKLINLS